MGSPARSASDAPGRGALAARPAVFAVLLVAASLASCARSAPAESFEGKRAYAWIERQMAFGPRAPGTPGHDSCFAYLTAQLRGFTPLVETDTFDYFVPELKRSVRLMNVVARFHPRESKRILLGAHWDTRPWADRDPDSTRRHLPVPGANDGGSGVAVLLELARLLQRHTPGIGVDIALFDGEDLGTPENPAGWFRGSKRYVAWKSGEPPPLFVIVVDMVGRRDAAFYWEGHSYEHASNIVHLVWERARKLGLRSFRSGEKFTVSDDHISFIEAGLPAIDIIDLDFPEWHTRKDDLSIIDPATLEEVGRVLLSLVTEPDFLDD